MKSCQESMTGSEAWGNREKRKVLRISPRSFAWDTVYIAPLPKIEEKEEKKFQSRDDQLTIELVAKEGFSYMWGTPPVKYLEVSGELGKKFSKKPIFENHQEKMWHLQLGKWMESSSGGTCVSRDYRQGQNTT